MPTPDPTRTQTHTPAAADSPTHTLPGGPPGAASDRPCAPGIPGGGSISPADPPAVPGYKVVGELGRGGMGIVYRARDTALGREAAIKTTLGGAADPRALIRFLAEAEAVAAVRHPRVVQVYAFGDAGGRPYLAMEYCPGGSLADRPPGRLAPRAAAELVEQVARGVAAAHAAGVVHRDLKPGNVLFDAAGGPKVTDFGIAKRLGADLTQTNAVMGTPAYMAPEQARGESKFVGPPADVWALGVVLYELLTGGRPFDADNSWAVLERVANADPAPVRAAERSVPRDLERVVGKCLAKAPHERYPTAGELADDLARFLAGEPVAARPVGAFGQLHRWARRNPAVAALSAAVVLLLVAGSAVTMALAVRAKAAVDERDELQAAWTRQAFNQNILFHRVMTFLAERGSFTKEQRQHMREAFLRKYPEYTDAEFREALESPAIAPPPTRHPSAAGPTGDHHSQAPDVGTQGGGNPLPRIFGD